jgi:hypothetical protein
MKPIIYLLFLVPALSLSSVACSADPSAVTSKNNIIEPHTSEEPIPVSISSVQMNVLGKSIVRIIQHNMELSPILQIELMSRPNFDIIDSVTIRQLPFKNQGVRHSTILKNKGV